MSYFLPSLIHLWVLSSKDIFKAKSSPYLMLSDRVVSSVQKGSIAILESWDIPRWFQEAHSDASLWHTDISNGISCLFKPEGINRETWTDFTVVNEDIHFSWSSFYQINPPQNSIQEINYRKNVGQFFFWDNRRYIEKTSSGLLVTKRIIHRKSEKWELLANPLRLYATFVDTKYKKLFMNCDF